MCLVLCGIFLFAFLLSLFSTFAVLAAFEKRKFFIVDLNKVPQKLSLREIKKLKEEYSEKFAKYRVVNGGGIAVTFSFLVIALITMSFIAKEELIYYLAAILSITLIATIGIVEDFIHMKQIYRVFLPLFASLPLIAVFHSTLILIPFLGVVNFGVAYSIIFIPLWIVASSNLVNLLAGFNGLEVGIGIIAGITMALISFIAGSQIGTLLSTALVAVCLGFLIYNWYPAKILGGNSLTYLIGGAIGTISIIANVEVAAIILMGPQIIEFFLKARSKFQAENFGRLDKNKNLKYNGKIYSLSHVLMKYFNLNEKQIVYSLWLIQILFAIFSIAFITL